MNKFIKRLVVLSVMFLRASSSIGVIAKNSVRILLILMGVTWSTLALAEGGCPEGQFPQQYGTTMGCTTMNAGGNQPVAPVWADRWGAIVSDGSGTYGFASDMTSKRKAQKAAIQDCINKGGGACELEFTYYNQCAAVGANEKNSFSWHSETKEQAESKAIQLCESNTGEKCRVFYSNCSMPVRVN